MTDRSDPPTERGEELARLRASPARRAFGIGIMVALGGLLVWLAISQPVAPGWRAGLIVSGAAGIWAGDAIRRATRDALILTRTGLYTETGRMIADLTQIESVDRGAFAFKPSNGFGLRLKSPGDTAWAPGLWWRFGRRVGVGGVTSAAQSKVMADLVSAMLAGHDVRS